MNLEIKITGSGSKEELAQALRQLADDLMDLADINISESKKNSYTMEYYNIICDLSEAQDDLLEGEDDMLDSALNDQLFN